MDEKSLKELRELVEFLKSNDIAEFDMEQDDLKVRLKFASSIVHPAAAAAPAGMDMGALARLMASQPTAAAPQSAASAPAAGVPAAALPAAVDPDAGLHMVKSPIVGTFYDAPSPGADPFVKVGDKVKAGQVLCIVEAMKLMNEIESDVAGEIVRVVPAAGQPVEYGQSLYAVKAG